MGLTVVGASAVSEPNYDGKYSFLSREFLWSEGLVLGKWPRKEIQVNSMCDHGEVHAAFMASPRELITVLLNCGSAEHR